MTAQRMLSDLHARWLTEKRGLGPETIERFDLFTADRNGAGEVVPDPKGNILVFPFIEAGRTVAEKYRGPNKQFWQRPGGKRTFWNGDILDDPLLAAGHIPLIITEGEIDALSAIDCGFQFTVSVPDGAPPVPAGKKPADLDPIDPNAEGSGKFEFLWNNRERLKAIKRFVIAVDNDEPGQRLAAELVRRLSASRCLFVTYPEGCKDLNDVLVQRGRDAVVAVINGARPYPVRGLYRLADYPELPEIPTVSVGWETLDRHLKMFAGEFMVVTGIPGHGKSTWVLNVVVNLAERYSWAAAVFSPEMPTVPQLRDKLRKIVLRKTPMELDRSSFERADGWINRNIVFIDADPTGQSDDIDFDLDWILDRATDAVLRDGIRLLVIDPWNEVEHARASSESMTDYIGRSIRSIKRFARLYEVAVIIVAHPTKDVAKEGKSRSVTLYDIEGSAHWFNKCDHGVVIDRPDDTKSEALIRVAKVRFEETGEKGAVKLEFKRYSSRFEMLQEVDENT